VLSQAPLRRDLPHVPWIGSLLTETIAFRIAKEIIVVTVDCKVEDIFVPACQAVLHRVGHTSLLDPNNPIAKHPSGSAGTYLNETGNALQALLPVRIAYV
jgi:hypothetical protein